MSKVVKVRNDNRDDRRFLGFLDGLHSLIAATRIGLGEALRLMTKHASAYHECNRPPSKICEGHVEYQRGHSRIITTVGNE
ncbi:MAG: hypothetical protein ACREF3_04915 [Acetobacteraceae bacterium]